MPEEKQVTIFVTDDGHVDLNRFAGDPHLAQVKQLVDGLRGSNEELKTQAARVRDVEKLGTPDEIATWKEQAQEAEALKARISDLEGKTMTDEERQELDDLRKLRDRVGDLDPDEAREALEYRTRTEQEKQLAAAFDAAGLNAKAALRLDGIRNLETRLHEQTVDGKTVKVPQVKVGDDWRPLTDHVESEYSDFLPVLKPSEEGRKTSPVEPARPRSGKGEPKSLGDAIKDHYHL